MSPRPSFTIDRLFVAKLFEQAFVIRPAGLDLDENFQIYLAAEQALHILPRFAGDAFEHGAALANNDAFVRLTVDENGGVDTAQATVKRNNG